MLIKALLNPDAPEKQQDKFVGTPAKCRCRFWSNRVVVAVDWLAYVIGRFDYEFILINAGLKFYYSSNIFLKFVRLCQKFKPSKTSI